MKCQYEHHGDSYGKELGKCKKHPDQELLCGPFMCKVCPKCDPFYMKPCGICGVPRYRCCC